MHTPLYLITLTGYRTLRHPGKSSFAILSPLQRQKVLILITMDSFCLLQNCTQTELSSVSCVWLLLRMSADSSMCLWASVLCSFLLLRLISLNNIQPAIYSCGFLILGFNQPNIENIWGGGSYAVADMYHVVRPMIVASVLNMYRLFILVIIP